MGLSNVDGMGPDEVPAGSSLTVEPEGCQSKSSGSSGINCDSKAFVSCRDRAASQQPFNFVHQTTSRGECASPRRR